MTSALCLDSMPLQKQATCDHCQDWTTTVESVLKVLSKDTCVCESCGREGHMRVVADQYQKRRPRWWIVGSTVVVPIWIVETLRNRKI